MSTDVAEKFRGDLLDADGHVYMEPDALADFASEIGGALAQDFYKRQVESQEFAESRDQNRAQLW